MLCKKCNDVMELVEQDINSRSFECDCGYGFTEYENGEVITND